MTAVNWFLLRVMYVMSPLPLVGGLALLVQGESGLAVVLLLASRLKRLVAAGLLTRSDARGQRAAYC